VTDIPVRSLALLQLVNLKPKIKRIIQIEIQILIKAIQSKTIKALNKHKIYINTNH
jgi:hypothetical protein